MKSKSIMVLGTASSVGKSIITAGLCRVFCQLGYKTAPFKSQNMALNSYITKDGKEMGRAQVVQAEASYIEPSCEMNPILLKPTSDKKCQVILNGKVHKNMSAVDYHDFKPELKEMISNVYNSLSSKNDVVVIEGAGSPAEINLRENDIVNMGMAEMSDSPCILVGDIDRGGVFASLAGTMLLLTEDEKKRIKGVVINKFRGDINILKPGIKMLEDIIKIPVLGVVPYAKLYIDDEDSLSEKLHVNTDNENTDILIEVIKLPHMSNFTDFNPFESIPFVSVSYISSPSEGNNPDLIIIPGSKNTIEDLVFLKKAGFYNYLLDLHNKDISIFGICGGFQILGNTLKDPHSVESAVAEIQGLKLLNMDTEFKDTKVTTQVIGKVLGNTPLLEGSDNMDIKGYEIHMGITKYSDDCIEFLNVSDSNEENKNLISSIRNKEGNVFGTYLHGIFENTDFTINIINNLRKKKGLVPLTTEQTFESYKDEQYSILASLLREHLDMDKIIEIMGLTNK